MSQRAVENTSKHPTSTSGVPPVLPTRYPVGDPGQSCSPRELRTAPSPNPPGVLQAAQDRQRLKAFFTSPSDLRPHGRRPFGPGRVRARSRSAISSDHGIVARNNGDHPPATNCVSDDRLRRGEARGHRLARPGARHGHAPRKSSRRRHARPSRTTGETTASQLARFITTGRPRRGDGRPRLDGRARARIGSSA